MAIKLKKMSDRTVVSLGSGSPTAILIAFALIFLVVGLGLSFAGFATAEADDPAFPVHILQIIGLIFCLVPTLILGSLWSGRRLRQPKAWVFDGFCRRVVMAEKGEDPFASSFAPELLPGYDYSQISELTIREYTISSSSSSGGSSTTTHHYVVCLVKRDKASLDVYHSLQSSDALVALTSLKLLLGDPFVGQDPKADHQTTRVLGNTRLFESDSGAGPGKIRKDQNNGMTIFSWIVPPRFFSLVAVLLFVSLFWLLLFNFDTDGMWVIQIGGSIILGIIAFAIVYNLIKALATLGWRHAVRIQADALETGLIPKRQTEQSEQSFKLERSISVGDLIRVQFFYSLQNDSGQRTQGLTLLDRDNAETFDMLNQGGSPNLSTAWKAGKKLLDDAFHGKGALFLDLPGLSVRELILFEGVLESEIRERGGAVD